MEIFKGEKKREYIQKNSIAHLFGFPIDEFLEVHEYERNEWIIKEGTRPDYLFYVMEGSAKIYATHQNGKVSLINFVKAHDYIGEMELLNEVYNTKGIQASTRMVCYALPFIRYREQLLDDAKFLRELTKLLSAKATFGTSKYSQGLAFPLENRLADFILQTEADGIYKEKHSMVCDYLGVSYRHLLYVLKQFCDKEYLKKSGRNYQIIHYDALYELAKVLKYK